MPGGPGIGDLPLVDHDRVFLPLAFGLSEPSAARCGGIIAAHSPLIAERPAKALGPIIARQSLIFSYFGSESDGPLSRITPVACRPNLPSTRLFGPLSGVLKTMARRAGGRRGQDPVNVVLAD